MSAVSSPSSLEPCLLFVVKPAPPNNTCETNSILDVATSKSLIDRICLVGRPIQVDDTDTLLNKLWQEHYWIACGCRSNPADRAIYYVRRSIVGRYSTVRINGRGTHSNECPCNDNRADGTCRPESSASPKSHTHSKYRFLSRLFDAVIRESGLLQRLPDNYGQARLSDTYRKLRKTLVKHLNIEGVRNFAVYSHPQALLEKDISKESFSVFCADHISRSRVRTVANYGNKNKPVDIRVRNEIIPLCDSEDDSEGPFLVLLSLPATSNQASAVTASSGVYIPIHSKRTLFPVSGTSGRITAERLLGLQTWLSNKHQVKTQIKGYFAPLYPADKRDTFDIENQNNQLISVSPAVLSDEEIRSFDFWSERPSLDHLYHYLRRTPSGDISLVGDKAFGRILTARLLANNKNAFSSSFSDKQKEHSHG